MTSAHTAKGKTMSDYIKREDAIKKIAEYISDDGDTQHWVYVADDILKRIPSADVVERQKYEQIKGLYEQSLIDRESMAKKLEATEPYEIGQEVVRCKECKWKENDEKTCYKCQHYKDGVGCTNREMYHTERSE